MLRSTVLFSEKLLWMDERWLAFDELMVYLGFTKDTVYTRVSSERMPGPWAGRFSSFDREEIDEQGAVGRALRVGTEKSNQGEL